MSDAPSSESVVQRVLQARESNQAITYCDESPDNEYPEIKWQFFGLIQTNEIATVARCGQFVVAACCKSPLLFPPMADRIFGVDVSDMQAALELGNEIWKHHREELLEAVEKQRSHQ